MNARNDDDQYDETLVDDDLDTVGADDETYDDSQDETWDDDADTASDSGDDARPPKKKGGSSNLIIIGLGVLAFLGFVYFKFSAPPSAQSAGAEQIAAETPADPAPVETVNTPAPSDGALSAASLETTGAGTPTESASDVVRSDAGPDQTPPTNVADIGAPPVSEEVAVTPTAPDDSAAMPQLQASPETTTQAVMGEATPVQQDPGETNVAEIPMVIPSTSSTPSDQTAETPDTGLPMSSQSTATIGAGSDDRVKKLEADLAELQSKVTTMTPSGQMGDIAAQLKEISNRLAALEKRKQPVTQDSSPSLPSAAQAQPKDDDAPSFVSTPVVRKEAPLPYRLRAVAQGRAYVTQGGRSGLMSVQVGDELDGLGRVQKIIQQNGAWVVVGSKGRIRQ